MRLPLIVFYLLSFFTTIHALALPSYFDSITEATTELWKRKGGGGGGGKGGSFGGSSSSGSSGSSSGSSGGSRSGSSSSGSSSSGSGSRSGASASYGGGRYYSGGAAAPYSAGRTSRGGIAPFFLGGAALAFFPGVWLYGAYAYPYDGRYTYYNETTNQNNTRAVECLCARYQQCGCDNNTEYSYLTEVANQPNVSRVATVDNTDTLFINGTLSNDTTDATTGAAPGSLRSNLLEMSGWWIVIAGVSYTMWLM